MAAALEVARGGRGVAVFLRGDPGLGKSRLLAHAAAAGADLTVVGAIGQDQEAGYPFALLHQVVEGLIRHPATGAAALTQAAAALRGWFHRPAGAPAAEGGTGARVALLYAFFWLISSVAEAGPLLLCVDDLHWSDPDSLEALRFLVRRLARVPLVLVGAMRGWPAGGSDLAEGLVREGSAELCDLQPLSPTAGAQVLQGVLGAPPTAAQSAQAARLTGGNPFLLEQLGRVWRAAPDAVPAGRERSLRRWPLLTRLRGLPAGSVRLLEAASVIGPSFRLDVAIEVAGLDPAEAEEALEPLEALGLLVADGDHWSFLHPLLQQALYDRLGEVRQRRLHVQVVERLRSRGAPPGQLAPQLAKAAEPGDRAALAELAAAALEAEGLAAYETAALHWGQALALCLPDAPEAAQLHYAVGRARQRAGDPEQACAAFAAALRAGGADLAVCARAHAGLGVSRCFVGDPLAARRHLDAALEAARGHSPALVAEMAITQAVMLLSLGATEGARQAVRQAWRAAAASGDPVVRAKALACRAWVGFVSGEHRAYNWVTEASPRLRSAPADELELAVGWSGPLVHGVLATAWGCYDDAQMQLEPVQAIARARRSLPALIWSSTFLADLAWRRGRLREALAWGDALPAQGLGLPWMTAEPRVHRGRVLMDMGDLEGAAAHFEAAGAEARAAGLDPARMLSLFGQASLAARHGDLQRALAIFGQAGEIAAAIGLTGLDPTRWSEEAIEALVHGGQLDAAAAVCDSMEANVRRSGGPGDEAIALRGRAAIAAAEGRRPEAEEGLARALQLHRRAGEALEEGRTLLALGSAHRRWGELSQARTVLDEACAVFEACGAGYWHRRGEEERRAAGGRRRSRARTGLLGLLTPQEYRVAELVSRGLPNREIAGTLLISPKTLETHLGHVYQKLDLGSRDALRAYFSAHAPAQEGTASRLPAP